MDRRTFLKAGGSTAAGLAAGGCAPALLGGSGERRPLVTLFPVEVSWDRIIRTTVGLRPHRDSGFMLKPERFDEKTVIHNFGHGGAGMSLSWGTGQMAAELALDHPERRAAVLGCGIVGLTAARQLQRRGFDVTIYTKAVPPYTTSNMSWAGFTPTSGLYTRRTPAWDAQFRRAVEIAYQQHQLLVGRGYGVSWIYEYSPADDITPRDENSEFTSTQLLPSDVETGTVILQPGEHPFNSRYARRTPTMRFEPNIYLEALKRDVLAFGGDIVIRTFDTPRDLMTLSENVIVNCTGLGSKELFGDEELIPIKGQLTVLVPQPEVNYSMAGMMPRSDGITLGHVQLRGDSSLEVNEEEQRRVVENAMQAVARLRQPTFAAPTPSLAMTSVPPVEAFFGKQS